MKTCTNCGCYLDGYVEKNGLAFCRGCFDAIYSDQQPDYEADSHDLQDELKDAYYNGGDGPND